MPEKRTIKKAQQAKRQGKSASTQAGAFVKESIDHVRKGKHGAKNAKQAIAIGLSEARRSGVAIPDKASSTSGRKKTTKTAKKSPTARSAAGKKTSTARKASSTGRASTGRIALKKTSPKRSAAALKRLKGEPTSSVSHAALSRHAKAAARHSKHAR